MTRDDVPSPCWCHTDLASRSFIRWWFQHSSMLRRLVQSPASEHWAISYIVCSAKYAKFLPYLCLCFPPSTALQRTPECWRHQCNPNALDCVPQQAVAVRVVF